MQSCPRKGKGYLVELRKVVERDQRAPQQIHTIHDGEFELQNIIHHVSNFVCSLLSLSLTFQFRINLHGCACSVCKDSLDILENIHRRKSPCLVCARTRRWDFTLICIFCMETDLIGFKSGSGLSFVICRNC
jgi:hypothetical protein